MYSHEYEFVIMSVTKGSAAAPAEGAYSALPDLLARFKGCEQGQENGERAKTGGDGTAEGGGQKHNGRDGK